MNNITPQQLNELFAKGENPELIDVRAPFEYQEVHAEFAKNVPLDQLDPEQVAANRNGSSGQPLYVICQGGNRSAKACEKFIAAGHQEVVNVQGGTKAWEAAGLPVKRGKKVMSLERQVRIAAGFLILVGAVLGFQVHQGFYGICAFVGAGLMFAGITDTCAMGMMIAKMPWNKVAKSCSADGANCST